MNTQQTHALERISKDPSVDSVVVLRDTTHLFTQHHRVLFKQCRLQDIFL